jgi:hypothetical protein
MAGAISNMSHVVSLEGRSSGKRYSEIRLALVTLSSPGRFQLGITQNNPPNQGQVTSSDGGVAWDAGGRFDQSNAWISAYNADDIPEASDVLRIAHNIPGGRVWMAINGGGWIGGGDPEADTDPTATVATGTWYLGMCAGYNVSAGPNVEVFIWRASIRTRADQFTHPIPAGFVQFA